jgi:hypothetical protein
MEKSYFYHTKHELITELRFETSFPSTNNYILLGILQTTYGCNKKIMGAL